MAPKLLIFEPSYRRSSRLGEVFLGPGIRPLDFAPPRKIRELVSPIQNLSGFLTRKVADYVD
jgi:hypothetical protein